MKATTTKPASIKLVSTAAKASAAHVANYNVFIDAPTAYDSARVTSFMGVSMAAGLDAATKGTQNARFDTSKPVAIITPSGLKSLPFKVKTFGGVPSGNRYRKYATLEEAEKALKAWAKRRFRVPAPAKVVKAAAPAVVEVTPVNEASAMPPRPNPESAIVNVHPASPYARYNGSRFTIEQVLGDGSGANGYTLALRIAGTLTDFTQREVIAVWYDEGEGAKPVVKLPELSEPDTLVTVAVKQSSALAYANGYRAKVIQYTPAGAMVAIQRIGEHAPQVTNLRAEEFTKEGGRVIQAEDAKEVTGVAIGGGLALTMKAPEEPTSYAQEKVLAVAGSLAKLYKALPIFASTPALSSLVKQAATAEENEARVKKLDTFLPGLATLPAHHAPALPEAIRTVQTQREIEHMEAGIREAQTKLNNRRREAALSPRLIARPEITFALNTMVNSIEDMKKALADLKRKVVYYDAEYLGALVNAGLPLAKDWDIYVVRLREAGALGPSGHFLMPDVKAAYMAKFAA